MYILYYISIGAAMGTTVELGPEYVSLLERCPHAFHKVVCTKLGPEGVPLLEIFPHFRGYIVSCPDSTSKGGKGSGEFALTCTM